MKNEYQVVIIGSGPAGMGAAYALKKAGIRDVVILEREREFGGAARHCLHPTFGLQTFLRPMTGGKFVKKIRARISEVPIETSVTVTAIKQGGVLELSTADDLITIKAERVVIATGTRETPRHPRLIGGLRPQGVLTTGALQQFIYLSKTKPFSAPVIVGTELVSFSALWTLKNAGIAAVAMVEENAGPTAAAASALYAKWCGVPIYYQSRIKSIGGLEKVEYLDIQQNDGTKKRICCDGVVFSGKFVGENTLMYSSHLIYERSHGHPITDQFGRCSDPQFFAVGNMLHPADMGDQCYQEGIAVGNNVLRSLTENGPVRRNVLEIQFDEHIKMVSPGCLVKGAGTSSVSVNMRVKQAITGEIRVSAGKQILYRKQRACKPEQRIMLKNIKLDRLAKDVTEVNIEMVCQELAAKVG